MHNVKVVFGNVQIAENERENIHNVKVVVENVQIPKIECENIHNTQYGKYNIILLH